MEKNTRLWLGLGVLGVLVIASLDTEVKTIPDTESLEPTEPTDTPKEAPVTEPKKVQL